jgi:hypothetical protein
MTIELDPVVESRLREAAAKDGAEPGEYAARLIERALPSGGAVGSSLWNALSPEEWIRIATEWAESHDRSIPLLSDEAVSRESFYEGRP